MSKLKLALILDNLKIKRWQLKALELCSDISEVVIVFNCTNTPTPLRKITLIPYYLLNKLCIQSDLTCKETFSKVNNVVSFRSDVVGSWQSLPDHIYESIERLNIDAVIKFGTGLLRTNPNSDVPILSYHHGNPSRYRGRPAIFYELLNGESSSGIIVQAITDKLDAGCIYAQADIGLKTHSYRDSIRKSYSIAPYLLRKALLQLDKGPQSHVLDLGKNYRLPSPKTVGRFIIVLLFRKVLRAYSVFFTNKKWRVGYSFQLSQVLSKDFLQTSSFTLLPLPDHSAFIADPFFSSSPNTYSIRVESLHKFTGLGSIYEYSLDDISKPHLILGGRHHHSFPFSYNKGDIEHLIPEIASFSSPRSYSFDSNLQMYTYNYLPGLEQVRAVDPIHFIYEENDYLFCSHPPFSCDILWLYFRPSGSSENYISHPSNPIRISPLGSRMAGCILQFQGRIYRIGQNSKPFYGSSLSLFEIEQLSPSRYSETYWREISFQSAKIYGPHTLNAKDDCCTLDFYTLRFDIAGFVRKALPLILRRLKSAQ